MPLHWVRVSGTNKKTNFKLASSYGNSNNQKIMNTAQEENYVITDEDIKHMEQTMQELGVAARSIDTIWKRAFANYNHWNTEKMNMNCSPCYYKVLIFLKK